MAPQARLKVASFTVRATMAQSVVWKRAAEAEGHASVGTWAAEALDRYLDTLRKAGKPLVLAWRFGRFRVALDGGEREVSGFLSPPFGAYRGSEEGPGPRGCWRYSLVYIPQRRHIATFRTYAQCKALASELARVWVRWGGSEPAEDPASLLQRFQREDL